VTPPTAKIMGSVLRETRERNNRHRKAHKKEKITLRKIHEATHVALGYISEIEMGKKYPSDQILRSILPYYGMTESELLHQVAKQLEKYEKPHRGDRTARMLAL